MPDACYQCEICGVEGPQESMDVGWAVTCASNPDCRAPLTHPKFRTVAPLTAKVLDELEWAADEGDRRCEPAAVPPKVLRALIDTARRDLESVAQGRRQRAALERVAGFVPDEAEVGHAAELLAAFAGVLCVVPSFLEEPFTPDLQAALESSATKALHVRLPRVKHAVRVTSHASPNVRGSGVSFDLVGTTAEGLDLVLLARQLAKETFERGRENSP